MPESNNKNLIVANWKMHKSVQSADQYMQSFLQLQNIDNIATNSDVVFCPPFTLIKTIKEYGMNVGGQDCSAFTENEGAFTGDISTNMLKDMGCGYVIVGHSERRKYHKESNELVKQKITNIHKAGLIAILCVGENLKQRDEGLYRQSLLNDLVEVVPESANFHNTIIAYEPLWAIGTGKTATIDQIEEIHQYLLEKCLSRFAFSPKIIYGGSVNLENSQAILDLNNVSGLLIGGASLDPEIFYKIIKIANKNR
jgi:triosephosphate isomerase